MKILEVVVTEDMTRIRETPASRIATYQDLNLRFEVAPTYKGWRHLEENRNDGITQYVAWNGKQWLIGMNLADLKRGIDLLEGGK